MKKLKLFLIILITLVIFSFLVFILKQKTDDDLILSKDPWKGMKPEAPFYTRPLTLNEIPSRAIKITSYSDRCQPQNFSVKKNDIVILVLQSEVLDQQSFEFEAKDLNLVKIIIDNKEPRGILFPAPKKEGSFTFTCGTSGKKDKFKGVMIVN